MRLLECAQSGPHMAESRLQMVRSIAFRSLSWSLNCCSRPVKRLRSWLRASSKSEMRELFCVIVREAWWCDLSACSNDCLSARRACRSRCRSSESLRDSSPWLSRRASRLCKIDSFSSSLERVLSSSSAVDSSSFCNFTMLEIRLERLPVRSPSASRRLFSRSMSRSRQVDVSTSWADRPFLSLRASSLAADASRFNSFMIRCSSCFSLPPTTSRWCLSSARRASSSLVLSFSLPRLIS